jgi:hypothetical protein
VVVVSLCSRRVVGIIVGDGVGRDSVLHGGVGLAHDFPVGAVFEHTKSLNLVQSWKSDVRSKKNIEGLHAGLNCSIGAKSIWKQCSAAGLT